MVEPRTYYYSMTHSNQGRTRKVRHKETKSGITMYPLYPRLQPDIDNIPPAQIVILTRWHPDDPAGRLMRKPTTGRRVDGFISTSLPLKKSPFVENKAKVLELLLILAILTSSPRTRHRRSAQANDTSGKSKKESPLA